MPPRPPSNLSVHAALAANLAIALVKFVAVSLTRSSALFSEGVHSLVDTSNEVLLLYGLKRAARPADLEHPASIGIALLLAVSSVLLARETKQLLIGESARPYLRESIVRIAGADPEVRTANGVITMQMGPHQVFAALSAEFEDRLDTTRLEQCVNRVEAAIKMAHPEVTVLFVKPQTAETWRRRIARLSASHDGD